jgi:ATP-binding cassette subfamily B protein
MATRIVSPLRLDDSITQQKVKPDTMRRIFPYAKQYYSALALLLTVTALGACTTVAQPILLGMVIDRGIVPHRLGVLIVLSLIMAGLGITVP